MKKYQILAAILLIALLNCVTACAPATPAIASSELNLYVFSEYVPKELITRFETETGVKVNYESYATNEEMLAGLANKPAHYDLIIPSDYAVETLIEQEALLPLDLSAIPNYKNLDPGFLDPYFDPGGITSPGRPGDGKDKFSLPYLWGTTGIIYNKTTVSTPPTSWEDLWRPELAGHIVVLDDSREMMGIALLTLGYSKNETNPARLEEARDKLKELSLGIVAFDAEHPENY
jgi:spermidine/putrescine-binding protein